MKCDFCGVEFDSKKSMANHRRYHNIKIKDKISKAMIGKNKKEKNGMWKGEKVSYGGLHDYIRYNKLKPKFCEGCGNNKKLELSNISGKYFRDLKDFKWLCRSCHTKLDYKLGIRIPRGKKN